MKKVCLIFFFSALLINCASTNNATNEKPAGNSSALKSGWEYYSEALYYKNLAINTKDAGERNSYLDQSIDLFEKAKEPGNINARIYYNLAEVYYQKGDLNTSLINAEQSIKDDNTYYPAYERIYIIRMDFKEYEEAAAVLENYLKISPEDLNVIYTLGLHYYKYLNNSDSSLEKFMKIIRLAKKMDIPIEYVENAYYISGYIYYTRNEFSKSLSCYRKVYEINQNNMVAVSMLAMTSMSENKIADAEKYALIYLECNPEDLSMQYILAQIYYMNDDLKAIKYLANIMRSKTFEGLYASGLYYELKNETERAENILKAVIKMKEDLVPAYIALSKISLKKNDMKTAYKSYIAAGIMAFRRGLIDVAERLFFKALGIKGEEDFDVYYYLARTQEEKKNYSMAISYYNMYYLGSKENDILVQIGYIHGIQKRYSTAYSYFDKATTLEPDSPVPFFFRGLVQTWEEKYSDANLSFQNAVNKKNDEETYYFYYAITWEKMQKIEQAIDSLKMAIKCNPSSARSLNYLAYIYADRNMNLDEAYTLVVKALDYEPDNGAYLDTLGWIYYRQGNYEKALDYILVAEEKLAEENSMDPVVYDHLGDTYKRLGQKENAILNWKKAFNMNGEKSIEDKIKDSKDEKDSEKE